MMSPVCLYVYQGLDGNLSVGRESIQGRRGDGGARGSRRGSGLVGGVFLGRRGGEVDVLGRQCLP